MQPGKNVNGDTVSYTSKTAQVKQVILPSNTLPNVNVLLRNVNKATTPKAKATYLKAKNTTTFPQHLYRKINVLRSNLQSSVFTRNRSLFHQYHHKT